MFYKHIQTTIGPIGAEFGTNVVFSVVLCFSDPLTFHQLVTL